MSVNTPFIDELHNQIKTHKKTRALYTGLFICSLLWGQ